MEDIKKSRRKQPRRIPRLKRASLTNRMTPKKMRQPQKTTAARKTTT